jgi:hypothetical protein
VAPECVCELRRLPITDAVRHLAHQHVACAQLLERPTHSHPGQVRAEARVADLGERALQLTPGRGDLPSNHVQVELASVIPLDNRHGLSEDSLPVLDRGISMGHDAVTRLVRKRRP